jgi:hypothetical protein
MDGDAARERESCRCVPEHVQRPPVPKDASRG